jgi:hypothetical protein
MLLAVFVAVSLLRCQAAIFVRLQFLPDCKLTQPLLLPAVLLLFVFAGHGKWQLGSGMTAGALPPTLRELLQQLLGS